MKKFFKKYWGKIVFFSILILGVILTLVTLGKFDFSKKRRKVKNPHNPNSVSDKRDQKIGEEDKQGNIQIPIEQKEKINIDSQPEGVDKNNIKENIEVKPKTNPDKTENHFDSVFKKKGKPNDNNDNDDPIRFTD